MITVPEVDSKLKLCPSTDGNTLSTPDSKSAERRLSRSEGLVGQPLSDEDAEEDPINMLTS